MSGSAGLPVPVFERLAALSGQGPIERYGMTETLITFSGRADEARRAGWVGRALPGVAVRVVDDDGQPVAGDGDSVGELEVRGPTLMNGYLHQPDATAALYTADGWLRTGDVAGVDRDGWHRIVGPPVDRPDQERRVPGRGGGGRSRPARPSGRRGGRRRRGARHDLGQVIVAYVVAVRGDGAGAVRLRGGALSVHKRPRRVEFVAELPRNAMGKVQKAALRA